ncbi:MAG: MFS transporter [Alphaproteobacteria bacterium]|nr:MFS transporter [Alphaproteobacteria bacterium]
MVSHDRPATRLATRLAFLVAGFGIACWAPLVPFAKQRLGVDDATLGLLMFCIGIGSLVAMQFTGVLCARHGAKPAMVAGGLGLTVTLPLLSVAMTPPTLAGALLCFGASLGTLEVATNLHAVEVERAARRPLMSGFHALFSIGGFAGAALMTFLLSSNLEPLACTLCCAAIMLVLVIIAWPRLLTGAEGEKGPFFVMPRGIVLLIAGLAAATFLAEGALLDWSALLITGAGLVPAAKGGVGYMLFAIAMTFGRLTGDAVTARIGDRPTLFWSGVLAVVGFVVLLTAQAAALAMAGFLLIGLGASNIVPMLFRKAGSQTVMPPALAIGAMTTAGYAGILAGPAAMGFVSKAVGLHNAFWVLAGLLCLVPLSARFVAGGSAGERSRLPA